ncbi:MAG: hypothetical protein ABI972_05020 [Acidobacteriota bacterium]
MRSITVLAALVALGSSAAGLENKGKSVQLKQLPASVQKTVEANLNGGEIRKITK